MSTDHIPSRSHVQGFPTPLELRASAHELTDGAGLVVLRSLLDRLAVGEWLDRRLAHLPGFFRPSLMVEVWVVLSTCPGSADG